MPTLAPARVSATKGTAAKPNMKDENDLKPRSLRSTKITTPVINDIVNPVNAGRPFNADNSIFIGRRMRNRR
jgi:hypothetical protein